MPSDRVAGGTGLVVCGVALPAALVLELATRGGSNGDDAAESVAYLVTHGRWYAASGLCLMLAGLALLLAATRLAWRSSFTTALAAVATALLMLAGAMRMTGLGAIDHVAELDPDWAESAYLTIQVVGTHGAIPGAVVTCALWTALTSRVAMAGRLLPRWVCLLGFVPLLYPLASVLSALTGGLGDAAWVASVLSFVVGLPLWFLAAGGALLVRDTPPAAAGVTTA